MRKDIELQGEAWRRATAMRDFLRGCEMKLRPTTGEDLASWAKQWLAWGSSLVEQIDPLTNGFLEKLPAQFGELKEPEDFVKQLSEGEGSK